MNSVNQSTTVEFFCGLSQWIVTTLLISVLLSVPYSSYSQDMQSNKVDVYLRNSSKYLERKEYDKAIDEAIKAYAIATEIDDKDKMAIAIQKEAIALISKTKREKANRKKAKERLQSSLVLLATSKNINLKIENLKLLRQISKLDDENNEAIIYQNQIDELNRLINIAASEKRLNTTKSNLVAKVENLSDQNEQLEIEKEQLNEHVRTLTEEQLKAELLIALQKNKVDSLGFQVRLDSFILAHNDMEHLDQMSKMQLQESELKFKQSQRNLFLALMGLMGVFAIAILFRYWETRRLNKLLQFKNEVIQEEREKSESLLLNILPGMVAEELKLNGVAKARRYDNATVFFSDFVNFSGISKNLTAEELVTLLDRYFQIFDEVITSFQLEKIKTIGDAYMCVGGLPKKNKNHAVDIVKAALEIQRVLNEINQEQMKKNEPFFEARIGIHTGPLVAGVVGSKKFAFDIWGDTVNVASRMESVGEAGKVNISKETYKLVKKEFSCTSRGKIPIKNLGKVEMFFVDGQA